MRKMMLVAAIAAIPTAAWAQTGFPKYQPPMFAPAPAGTDQSWASPGFRPPMIAPAPEIVEIRPNSLNPGNAGNAGSSIGGWRQRELTCVRNPYIPTQCQ